MSKKMKIELDSECMDILVMMCTEKYGFYSEFIGKKHLECLVDALLRKYDMETNLPFPEVL